MFLYKPLVKFTLKNFTHNKLSNLCFLPLNLLLNGSSHWDFYFLLFLIKQFFVKKTNCTLASKTNIEL